MASIEDDPKFDGVFMSVIQQKQGINGQIFNLKKYIYDIKKQFKIYFENILIN